MLFSNTLLNKKEQLSIEILEVLKREETAITGSCTLASIFNEKGYNVSEATVGRLLREFDNKKYTKKNGFKGRTLLEGGKKYLEELQNKSRSLDWGFQFFSVLDTKNKDDLIEVLIARRAIEGELAYLAAHNVTKEDIIELENILKEQESEIKKDKMIATIDRNFHMKISSIAKNKLLEAAISIIREEANLYPVFDYIRRYVHGNIYIDHKNILDAIKLRSPDKAKNSMIKHINNIIGDIDNYWKIESDAK